MNSSADELMASFENSALPTPPSSSASTSRNASSSSGGNLGVPVLMRSSQPRVGLTGQRSVADEALLRCNRNE